VAGRKEDEGGGIMRCVVGRWGLDVFCLDLA